jgi:hypothetical protein
MANDKRRNKLGRNEKKRCIQMKKQFAKGQYLVIAYIGLLLLLFLSPFWLWAIKDSNPLQVLILDKTVPDETYREHKGLVWLLNNEKYVNDENEPYSLKDDYFGFIPKGNHQFLIKELPKQLSQYDVIYLADQYGVYEEEFYNENQMGKRSKILYGGLKLAELEQIENTLFQDKGKTLIAEFNTFASPTTNDVRMKISNLLNVKWRGWIGRYFPNLASEEVPIWVKDQYAGKWNFNGGGLIFVNEDDYVYVAQEKDLTQKGVPIHFTKNGDNYFKQNLNSVYDYWFDILDANSDEEILANFHLPVNEKTMKELKELGIPETFPAITHHENVQFQSFYFSGDFADETEVPSIYQTRGLSQWKRTVSERDSFYWKTYVPMMKYILKHGLEPRIKQERVELIQREDVSYNSQTGDQYIQVQKNGEWKDFLIKGVNMGIAKPGYFPGETAITKDEYFRWFKAIGEMNANSIRVYTLHPPAFYEAFYEYNQVAKSPLYLFHGAWVTEESLIKSQNAFSEEVVNDFKLEIRQMIDIIHGNITIAKKTGHASGEYKTDVSPYILGLILGIEWDPHVVQETNKKNKDIGQWEGTYFQTTNGSPFEVWLAQMMEYAASYETKQYGWQHSMSFTNWVTTDLLEHPAEPSEDEDLVAVNPNHIQKKKEFHAGLFASYHIYPYYPDFLNYEQRYLDYIDMEGKPNSYAGYLNDLIKVHEMPVLVAEFGVPASRGLTHVNPFGMDQGNHSEQEQGEINKRLYHSIVYEGYAGGLVFTWQDEWFKRTWNTMDLDNPDRRPYWSNVQTNEQHFGLLSFEPSSNEKQLFVDGLVGDWNKLNLAPIYRAQNSKEFLQQIDMHADQSYLYAKLIFQRPVNWVEDDIFLLFDTISNQGQHNVQLGKGKPITSDLGTDFMVSLKDQQASTMMVDSYYDPFYYQYGEELGMIPQAPYANRKNNGIFHPIRLALNKELVVPSTNKRYPFVSYESGKLLYGDGNPAHKEFNSLTDFSMSMNQKVLEIRIPWQLLNVKDPSMREALGDLWKGGLESSTKIDNIMLKVLSVQNKELQDSEWLNRHITFTWQNWEQPHYEERLKQSYYIMQEAFNSISIKGGDQ